MNIVFLARVDALAQRWRQWMVLVQHDRDLAVAFAQHHSNVSADEHSQTLLRVRDGLDRTDHPLFSNIHCMVHQVEEDFVLALKVMVKPAFTQLQGRRHIVHRSAVVALLLKQAGGGTKNFLAGISRRALTGHRRTIYTNAEQSTATN